MPALGASLCDVLIYRPFVLCARVSENEREQRKEQIERERNTIAIPIFIRNAVMSIDHALAAAADVAELARRAFY